ncbi:GNAT family N-acetyltransferase [Neisseria leonii]|uniref:GNAT family N-acetyltransferase n=1 Tax=Neisseria leonii TaxID=2995413 RepID=UPI00237A60E4|nr:GNAT family N-acetyltransferase [Neisseria sp. 3986]MDD9325261.1 GNAT family N-acetyltransferase [Neisseria sp. 3986]
MPADTALPDGLTVRPAEKADLPDIVAIYNSTVPGRRATADLHPVSVADRRAWFDAHGGTRPLYVVENAAGTLLAWGSFSDYYPRDAYRISAEISIYVRESARGCGLGRRLAEYMCRRAPALGIRNIIAVIFAHNTPSLHLFERLGFESWGRLPEVCDMAGSPADVVIMGKKVA